jgi:fructokinase
MAIRTGVDLGGTKIEAAVLDHDGAILVRQRVATPQGDYPGTVEAIASLVERAEAAAGQRAPVLGIGIPGTISPASGLIKNANSVWLIGEALDRDLQARLERPVRITNDANCFALSEAVDGAGAGYRVVFGIILGTGCGSGLVVNQQVISGPNAITGEWGHNPLPWPRPDELPGPECYCGQRGCLEVWISGTGMGLDYRRALADPSATATSRDVIRLAREGDAIAVQCTDDYMDRLARALASIINIIDPDAIVVGGGMSNVAEIYQRVPQLWGRYVFSDRVDTPLLQARHGDSSGVRGAAWL